MGFKDLVTATAVYSIHWMKGLSQGKFNNFGCGPSCVMAARRCRKGTEFDTEDVSALNDYT